MVNMPIKTYKVGGVSLNLWENKQADNKIVNSYTFNRSYKDKEGNWKRTDNLSVNDLPKLELCLKKAFEDATLLVNNN